MTLDTSAVISLAGVVITILVVIAGYARFAGIVQESIRASEKRVDRMEERVQWARDCESKWSGHETRICNLEDAVFTSDGGA